MKERQFYFYGFWLLLFTVGLLLVGSSDGWLHFPVHRADTAWFMMGGKSWVAGLRPYVDFTDSKGPLLWLLYGIGWLISPYNFYGVFIIEVLFYWVTFLVLYKTAVLIAGNRPIALLASMGMGLLFFAPGLHQELLIEDYCHLFNALSFYLLVKTLTRGEYRNWYGVIMGLCGGAALMMKYSYFLTLLVPALFIFLFLLGERAGRWWRFLLWYVTGWLAMVAPFLVYFLASGTFEAFISEYFLNTFSTIRQMGAVEDSPRGFFSLYFSKSLVSAFIWLITICFLITLYMFRAKSWMVWALTAWYVISIIPCCMVSQVHLNYFLYPCIFAFGGAIWFAERFRGLTLAGAVTGGAVIIALLAWSTAFCKYSEFYHIDREQESRSEMERVAQVINSRQKKTGLRPTISYYHASERGEHILTDAVAGHRYWSLQAGMTPEMMASYEQELFTGRPDFIIVKNDEEKLKLRLAESGYKARIEYAPWGDEAGLFILYEK